MAKEDKKLDQILSNQKEIIKLLKGLAGSKKSKDD